MRAWPHMTYVHVVRGVGREAEPDGCCRLLWMALDAQLPLRSGLCGLLGCHIGCHCQLNSLVDQQQMASDLQRCGSRLRDSNPRPTHYETVAPRSTPTFRIPDHAQRVHSGPRPSVRLAANSAANHSAPQQVRAVGRLLAARSSRWSGCLLVCTRCCRWGRRTLHFRY